MRLQTPPRVPGACLLGVLVLAGAAHAELRTVRGLGAAPAPAEKETPPSVLRNRAIEAALRDAVVSIAEEVVARTPGVSAVLTPEELLDPDPARYVPSYRILEDRGVRGASPLLGDRPGPHYVVLVEATIDVSAIRRAVSRAAPVRAEPERGGGEGPAHRPGTGSPEGETTTGDVSPLPAASEGGLLVVLEEAASYAAVQAVRRLLVEDLGASAARPVLWEPGRVALEVVGPFEGVALAERLRGLAPGELGIEVVEARPDGLRIRAWLRAAQGVSEGRAVPRFPD